MAVFAKLLRRLGFVRLESYGLVLTFEDRIQSTRSHVLEDVDGAPVVGWRDSDLAVAELAQFGAAKPAPRPIEPPAKLIASLSSQALPRYVDPAPERPLFTVSGPVAPVAVAPVVVAAPVVEAEEPANEWDWEIALARARAAAEESERAAAAPRLVTPPAPIPVRTPAPKSDVVPFRRTAKATIPPPIDAAAKPAGAKVNVAKAAERSVSLPGVGPAKVQLKVVKSGTPTMQGLPNAPKTRIARGTDPIGKTRDDTEPTIPALQPKPATRPLAISTSVSTLPSIKHRVTR